MRSPGRVAVLLVLLHGALELGGLVLQSASTWPGPCARAARAAVRMGPEHGPTSDRMANDGLLYEGWGAEEMDVLNKSVALMDNADQRGLNRYELALALARRAKEIAHISLEKDEAVLSSGLHPVAAAKQAAGSFVVRAVNELQGLEGEELDAALADDEEEEPPELDEDELVEDAMGDDASPFPGDRDGADFGPFAPERGFFADGGFETGAGAPGFGPERAVGSASRALDGDGGGAAFDAINRELALGDGALVDDSTSLGAGIPGADAAADVGGIDALLAALESDGDFDEEELDGAIDGAEVEVNGAATPGLDAPADAPAVEQDALGDAPGALP